MDNDFELTIAQVINKYRLLGNRHHSKSLGQHFLCDESLLNKIVSCALPFQGNDIIEIGPGPGGLTRSIIKFVKEDNKIFCIEKDESLKPVHDNLVVNSNVSLNFIYGDALKIKPQALTDKKVTIISNLPYNVGTQIFINWLKDLSNIDKFVLMFQKEVANRICAKPNSKDYGRLSIISQLLCDTEKIFDISNLAFFPPPKVTSTVIKLIPRNERIADISELEKLTEICFRYRRKTIYSILKRIYPKFVDIALECCNIEVNSRPENISPEGFLLLSRILKDAQF